MPVELTVVGSINLDLVARVDRLPRPGETVSGWAFERFPGGKGANQAVAAARLGARVRMIGAVGADALADEALVGLRGAGVELDLERAGSTGLALILVAADGENQIVVVPGANAHVRPHSPGGAVLCQLEVPNEVVLAAAEGRRLLRAQRRAGPPDRHRAGPADRQPARVRGRLAREARRRHLRRRGRGALRERSGGCARDAATRRRGRRHRRRGRVRRLPRRLAPRGPSARRERCARAPPARSPPRNEEHNLLSPPRTRLTRYSRHDADPIILDCDPGHDDAIALLLAVASPEVELVGVTTVAGNQTVDKTTANALRILELAGRSDIPVYRGAGRAVHPAAGRRGPRARRERSRRP